MACFSVWDIQGCGCGGCTSPTFTGNVKGCNSLNLVGYTVEAHDSTAGGTLLGSTTTDSFGDYTLTGLTGQTIGNNIVIVVKGNTRLNDSTTTYTYTSGTVGAGQWTCGTGTTSANVTLTPATGYVCIASCAVPVKSTLTAAHSVFGSSTATLAFGTWAFSWTYAYGGDSLCPPGTIAITATFSPTSGFSGARWATIGPPGTFSACPDDTGAGPACNDATGSLFSCPPSFLWDGTITITSGTASCGQHMFGVPTSHTISITE